LGANTGQQLPVAPCQFENVPVSNPMFDDGVCAASGKWQAADKTRSNRKIK
jgi:hypothetical protein